MWEVTDVLRLKPPSLPPPGPPDAVLLNGWGLFLSAIRLGPLTLRPPPPYPPCDDEDEEAEEGGEEEEREMGGGGGGGGSRARDWEEAWEDRWWWPWE